MQPTLILALFTHGIFAATTANAPQPAQGDGSNVSAFNQGSLSVLNSMLTLNDIPVMEPLNTKMK